MIEKVRSIAMMPRKLVETAAACNVGGMRITLLCLALAACSSEKRDNPYVAAAKRCRSDAEMSCPRPIIRVENFKASQRYFVEQMGFTVAWDYGDPPDFGAVKRGDFELFMCLRCQSTPGAWSMTFMKDVDPYHEELVRRGARIVMPPTDMPWGLREMHVADLDGNVIRFGSHEH
jgi:predicted enzyme related to lactoylglutathione lyase